MSSMRNAVQRRNHKERAQPPEREKWGVLEKHKDYSLRAKDYNEKKARLKILRQKAAERNPDEFHYGMLSSTSKKGRKLADRGNLSLSQDAVKLLKTQDLGYLQTMIQKTQKAIRRFEHEFVLVEGEGVEVLGERAQAGGGQHLIFVDDKEAQRQYDPKSTTKNNLNQPKAFAVEARKDVEDAAALSIREANKPNSNRKSHQEALAAKEQEVLRKRHRKEQDARRIKLVALKTREKDLRDAQNELQVQRARMSNSVGGVNKKGLKWKVRERRG